MKEKLTAIVALALSIAVLPACGISISQRSKAEQIAETCSTTSEAVSYDDKNDDISYFSFADESLSGFTCLAKEIGFTKADIYDIMNNDATVKNGWIISANSSKNYGFVMVIKAAPASD